MFGLYGFILFNLLSCCYFDSGKAYQGRSNKSKTAKCKLCATSDSGVITTDNLTGPELRTLSELQHGGTSFLWTCHFRFKCSTTQWAD